MSNGSPSDGVGAAAGTAPRRRFRPQDGRQHNLALVTQALYDQPGLSRADLARLTGLTRVTISDLVAELLADGLLVETGASDEVRPGKRATKLQVNDKSRTVLAVDLSGESAIVGAAYTLGGELRQRVERPLSKGDAALSELLGVLRELLATTAGKILGLGVGTPGTVEGDVVTAANLDWHFLDLRKAVASVSDIPVEVENDANLAAMAERRFAGGQDDLIRVQISRGVGAGLLLGGAAVTGSSGAAGEIGHVVIEHNGAPCSCGKRGCLETWISVPALSGRIEADPGNREQTLAEAGRRLGMALSPIIGMLDLVDVVVGGPNDLVEGAFLEAAQAMVTERIGIESRRPVRLRQSTLGEDAVLLGATALVLRNQLGVY
ncbi:MAG: ROK family transcriptional regulator [Propionibacteriaceae bacterium]|jgi:predicted NBD/HSP70 family sugar kinase|nr:ROK family transcriptional regulator [Propionibacteriaceae bacterium]